VPFWLRFSTSVRDVQILMRPTSLHSSGFRVAVALFVLVVPAQLGRVIAQDINIPETTFSLPNGLTVVVSEDRA
jgi:hypothetical protein